MSEAGCDTSAPIPDDARDRVAKLIPRLSSSHDGEVVATARAIGRVMSSIGLTFHELAAIVRGPRAAPLLPPPARGNPPAVPFDEKVDYLFARRHLMSPDQALFIEQVRARLLGGRQNGMRDRTAVTRLFIRLRAAEGGA